MGWRLEVDVGGSTKTVPKAGATFEFEAEDAVARVDGDALVAAPADRTREKYEVTRCRA
ncbi:MAG: ribonuclease P protein subunit [Halobacteriota archaeon]